MNKFYITCEYLEQSAHLHSLISYCCCLDKSVVYAVIEDLDQTGLFSDSCSCSRLLVLSWIGIMRKPVFCICENKDADQLCDNCTADQCLCFCH